VQLIVYAALYLRLARNEETESATQEELARKIAKILKPVRNITTMKEDLFVNLLSKSKRELRDIVFIKPMHVRIRLDSKDHPKADNSRDVILTDSSVEVDVSLWQRITMLLQSILSQRYQMATLILFEVVKMSSIRLV